MSDKSAKPGNSGEPGIEKPGFSFSGLKVEPEKPAKPGDSAQNPAIPEDNPVKPDDAGFDASGMYRCLVKDPDSGLVCGRLIKNDREAIREHERRAHGIKVNKSRKPAKLDVDETVKVTTLPIESLEKLQKVTLPAKLPRPEDIAGKRGEMPVIAGSKPAVKKDIDVFTPEIVETKPPEKENAGFGDLAGLLVLGALLGGLVLVARMIMRGPREKGDIKTPQNPAETIQIQPVVPAPASPAAPMTENEGPRFVPPGVPIFVR